MMHSASKWALCIGALLALPAAAYAQSAPSGPLAQAQVQGQGPTGTQGRQPQQMGSQDQMTQQEVNTFLRQTGQVLKQAAMNRNPQQVAQYLRQNMAEDASITTVSELYLGNRLIGQTFAHIPEYEISDTLGLGAPVLHGRRLLQDYNVDMNVQNIELSSNQERAKAIVNVTESGTLNLGELAGQAMARMQQHMGTLRGGMGGGQQGQAWGQDQQGSPMQGRLAGQFGQQGQFQGQGPRWRQFGIGGLPESLRFQGQTECTLELSKENGQIKLGNTFCRAINQLG
jgi:hypothetical protein